MLGNQISLTNNVAKQVVSVTATQNQTDFTVQGGYRINQLGVYRNGVRQVDGRDYIARNGATVTLLSQGANAGDAMEFVVFDDFRVADALSVNAGGTINAAVNIKGSADQPTLTFDGSGVLKVGDTAVELAIGRENANPFGSYLQARASNGAARDILLNPVGGDVGIGTDNPQSGKLHVAGSIRTGRSDSIREGGAIVFERAADGTIAYEIDAYGEGTSDATNLRIVDSIEGEERVRVSAGGSVGIGTTVPRAKFEVIVAGNVAKYYPDDYSDPNENWVATFANEVDTSSSNGVLIANRYKNSVSTVLQVGGLFDSSPEFDTYFIVNGEGRVGLGTTNPTNTLEVQGDLTVGGDAALSTRPAGIALQETGVIVASRNNASVFVGFDEGTDTATSIISSTGAATFSNSITVGSGDVLRWGSSDSATIIGNEGNGQSGYLAFSPNNEKVRILATGRTGIGTTNPESILNLFGQGGTTSALGNSENIGATLVINDSDAQANSGGCIRFGNIQSVNSGSAGMAAIKALLSNGNDNTIGHLAFSTRRVTTDATMTEAMRIQSDGKVGINEVSPNGRFSITTALNEHALRIDQNHTTALIQFLEAESTSYAGDGIKMHYFRGGTSAMNFLACDSDHSGTPDRQFTLRGDGQAFADGSWNPNGADYAEYFESSTGAAIPVGTTVVLENNKVRAATSEDSASSIMGVIRPKAPGKILGVVGNSAWNKWTGKYLTDDFDRYILDEHVVYEWTETVEDGDDIFHSYESHRIPEGVTIPSDVVGQTHDAKGNRFVHYRLNPDFDPSLTYVPREERDEWVIVGLMGQVKILDGQPMNDRWVKMRDVSDSVEEWFIR